MLQDLCQYLSLESTGNVEFYYIDTSNLAGGIMLDDNGSGTDWESQYRMFIYTNTVGGEAFSLKLLSAGGMSLESNKSIYAYAPEYITFECGGDVKVYNPILIDQEGGTWNFNSEGAFRDGTLMTKGNVAVFG